MQIYKLSLIWKVENPKKDLTTEIMAEIFQKHATSMKIKNYCQFFESNEFLPAPEIIRYFIIFFSLNIFKVQTSFYIN
jgi:hypothetical protein